MHTYIPRRYWAILHFDEKNLDSKFAYAPLIEQTAVCSYLPGCRQRMPVRQAVALQLASKGYVVKT